MSAFLGFLLKSEWKTVVSNLLGELLRVGKTIFVASKGILLSHHLSGPNGYAQTQTSLDEEVGCWCKIPASLSLRKQVYPPVNSHIR
jgi:hypothetical protein